MSEQGYLSSHNMKSKMDRNDSDKGKCKNQEGINECVNKENTHEGNQTSCEENQNSCEKNQNSCEKNQNSCEENQNTHEKNQNSCEINQKSCEKNQNSCEQNQNSCEQNRNNITLDDDVNINKIVEKMSVEEPEVLTKIFNLMKNNNCLNFYPLLTPYHNIEKIVDILMQENYEYENTWTVHCDASFICRLLYEGFIPVASKQKLYKIENYETVMYKESLLIPKIHFIRSCMHPSEIHISKKVKKKCKHFHITIDKNFEGVMEGIVEKHGQNWLYPFVQEEFKKIFYKDVTYKNVELHSVELWFGKELVAGEIGNTVGSIYTSLTGFQRKSCAGTIQLCALAKLLEIQKFQLWDLGMLLPYKKDIGSKEITMKEFFRKHRLFKHQHAEFKTPFMDKLNCSVLIKGINPQELKEEE
ncbi:Leu/Phe-tRNA protein transferase, putative [Plasmodium reichenowi]|uniref:Leu/Phe-tRNA protein transferase, putative n=1 Tax=Plasmodium reichenowi TaxID=5854 RepID=A0A2P9D2X8_PLARE|nr:Leu/Phe-tRNA protein transferase, putative [Plasmodium reichenowi]